MMNIIYLSKYDIVSLDIEEGKITTLGSFFVRKDKAMRDCVYFEDLFIRGVSKISNDILDQHECLYAMSSEFKVAERALAIEDDEVWCDFIDIDEHKAFASVIDGDENVYYERLDQYLSSHEGEK